MQYESVFKSDSGVHVILAFLKLLLLLKLLRRWLLWYWYWGSSDGSTSTHEHMAKTIHNINIHANNGIY